jgi:hypothetical protein
MYKVLTILQTTNYVDIKVSTVMVVIPQERGYVMHWVSTFVLQLITHDQS